MSSYYFFIVNLHLVLEKIIFVPCAVNFGMCSVFVKMAVLFIENSSTYEKIKLWY